jgi:hypothetical protein
MTRLKQTQTNFTAGEVSPDLLGRGDLRAYENGANRLRNVVIQPTGGVTRRAGLRYVATAPGNGRLIAFEFATNQTALLVLSDVRMDVYVNNVFVTNLVTPWVTSAIPQVTWTQSADTLLLAHPDLPPMRLTRSSAGVWSLNVFSFSVNGTLISQPYFKYADQAVTVTPSATTGSITITASAAVFTNSMVNTRLRINDREVLITAFTTATQITGTCLQALTGTTATQNWKEQAFSPLRGYPVSFAFHQDRLVIGGSRSLPNRLWMSRSGDLFNFELGTGIDDDAIEFGIFSDEVNAIRGLFSGRHLQVFTSGAEWMVTGNPLTPVSVQITRQTRVGSPTARHVPPIDVDGATLFVNKNGQELREFVYTDVEQAYQSTDLSLLSRHIISNPVDQDFDQRRRLLVLVRGDGRFATLTVYRPEQVAAWTLHETDGTVISVSVAGDTTYFLVQRGSAFLIERMDDSVLLDSSVTATSGTAQTVWTGLTHLNGRTVRVIADGNLHPDRVVSGGQITLAAPATFIQVGLSYTHIIEPLPLANTGVGGEGRNVRPISFLLRLSGTRALTFDAGRGLRALELALGQVIPALPVSRDIKIAAYGWVRDFLSPLWRIEQSQPLPFTLLSVTTELKINE